ncbi:F-box protein [Ceratobasidium sp. AG-Ba]|nr:F-box protein [Ceratobasidium sp. AG-Ba]
MPSVICHRVRSQDCASLGHLYRSSPNAAGARPVRAGRHTLRLFVDGKGSGTGRRGLAKSPSPSRVSLPLLLILSPEIVLLVLAELPGLDILRCRTVCKLLKLFIDNSAQLRYIVEAHARGFEPLHNANCAQHHILQLLARERSWAMFGSIPGMQTTLDRPTVDDDNDNGPAPAERILYDSGRMFVVHGSHVTVWTLGPRIPSRKEYVVPGLNENAGDSIIAFGDQIAFSTSNAVCVYSLEAQEIVRVLLAIRGRIIDMRVQGDYLAGLFRPERQSSGATLWNWKTGLLIDTFHSTGSPVLSFTFLNKESMALVRTDRSARSAQIDVYEVIDSKARLRSSLALPDTHPTKWYSKAHIYASDAATLPECELLQHDAGVVAISVKLRVRSPHDPATTLSSRKLSMILVVRKRALNQAPPSSTPIPWSEWSSNQFRVLAGVKFAPISRSSPVWGSRIVALGPDPDKISLFDFCAVGAKAASVVWKAPNPGGVRSVFSGGGGGGISGGVSVRAALAQRARTLVRANSLGIGAGWFEGMGISSEGTVEQMPYVVAIRRGMSGVYAVTVDGERVVVLKNEENSEGSIVSRVTSFLCSI